MLRVLLNKVDSIQEADMKILQKKKNARTKNSSRNEKCRC